MPLLETKSIEDRIYHKSAPRQPEQKDEWPVFIDKKRSLYSDLKPREIYKKMTTVSLTFGEPTSMAFDDLV